MNNREISILIWSIIGIVWVLSYKRIRSQIGNLVKMFFAWKLSLWYIAMTIYVVSILVLLLKINLWNTSMMKDTITWVLFSGLILLVNTHKADKEQNYFKNIILDNLKIITIVEFITNVYVFNIIAELILVPILVFLGVISAFASLKNKYLKIKKVTDFILSMVGFFFVIYALYKIKGNYTSFSTTDNLRSFILSPILTLFFLPFLYIVLLFMNYENLFIKVDFMTLGKTNLKKNIKYNIIKKCLFNLPKLNRFSKELRLYDIQNESEILIEIKRVNNIK